MKNIYIITGPAGVGKSTISKEIAKQTRKSALIEGDIIYRLVYGGYIPPWKKENHLKVFWKNSLDIICNFLNNGYDVIFNYIIDRKRIEKIKNEINERCGNNIEIKFIILLAKEEVIIERDKNRKEENQMKERVLTLLESFKRQKFNERYIIDTSNISIEETVKKILNEDKFILDK